jgi:hypothetical protein
MTVAKHMVIADIAMLTENAVVYRGPAESGRIFSTRHEEPCWISTYQDTDMECRFGTHCSDN